ncbi:MAG TPA: hypothetical protein GX503_01760 [Clostridiales bacterium]|nr:hypothetical protein [Clostridiales bacterium]
MPVEELLCLVENTVCEMAEQYKRIKEMGKGMTHQNDFLENLKEIKDKLYEAAKTN